MVLIERPHPYCYAKNDIRYVFELADLERPNLVLQVKLRYAKMSAPTATDVVTFFLKPAADGKVFLYIQSYINSLLDYVMPVLNALATDASNECCRFHIHFREVDDNTPDPVWITTEQAKERIAIKGGIEKHKARRNNLFINYIDTQKPFLTWQPSGRFVFYDEPLYLSFLNKNKAAFKLKIAVYATDGTSTWTIINFANPQILVHLAVSGAQLNLLNLLNKQLYFYELSVLADDGATVLVNPYRLYLEYRPVYESYDLVYHNSLGGIDTVRVMGETKRQYQASTTESVNGLQVNDAINQVKPHETIFSDIRLQKNYKGNIGVLKTRSKQEQEAFLELFVSKGIYMLYDARWIPVLHIAPSADLGSRKNRTEGFAVEWRLSETNEVFTPDYMAFGAGIDNEDYGGACVPVTIDPVALPNGIKDVAYNQTIQLAGTAPFTLTVNNKPAWMTISLSGDEVTLTGTPTAPATNITISFTVNNCSNSSDAFSDTIDVINTFPLSVSLARLTSPSRLSAVIFGGLPPYNYTFYCNASGTCHSFTINDPTGTTNLEEIPFDTTYSVIDYAAATYQFFCSVTDANGSAAVSNGVTEPFCLVPETLITMADRATKPLADVIVGELLLEGGAVLSKTTHTTDTLYVINDGLLKTSPGHINILEGHLLRKSVDLKIGNYLLSQNGTPVEIISIAVAQGNFEVINIATTTRMYIANGILTHNKIACP